MCFLDGKLLARKKTQSPDRTEILCHGFATSTRVTCARSTSGRVASRQDDAVLRDVGDQLLARGLDQRLRGGPLEDVAHPVLERAYRLIRELALTLDAGKTVPGSNATVTAFGLVCRRCGGGNAA